MPDQTPAVGMERKLAAIFSTDVAGYSRLMGDDEEATIHTLTASREIISSLIQHYRGRVVDSPGDNLLAEFASVVDAVRSAVEIQQALKEKNVELPEHRRMKFRIGINLGDVIVEGERLYGDGVNIAARLESLAIPGGICISGAAYEQVRHKVALRYEDLGEQAVKNIADPVRVYRVGVDESSGQKSSSQQAKVEAPKPRRVLPAPRWVIAGLVLIAVTLGVIRYFSRPSLSPQSSALITQEAQLPLPDKPSLIVLPFVNMSKDPDQEYFSDGLTEVLTGDLSKISSLFVIARNSAFTYKGKAVKVQDVGREMGVRYVLEGSVLKAGDKVRINVQLVDATTGYHLWSERYDRDFQDIFALQDEIVQKVVLALKVKLTQEEQIRFRHAPTDSLNAYDFYLRGCESYYRYTKEGNGKARQMFERAIEQDPQYAGAYVWLGWTYLLEWAFHWGSEPQQSLERAFELAQQARALDDSLAAAHLLLSWVSMRKQQPEQAIAEAKRALALDPNYHDGYGILADALNSVGRPEEAIEQAENAIRLNPRYSLWYWQLGYAYRLAGRIEEAIAAQKQSLIRDPNFQFAYVELVWSYVFEWSWQLNQDAKILEQPFEAARKAIALGDSNPWVHTALGRVYLWQKQPEQALAEAEEAIALDPNVAEGHAVLAEILNAVGKPEEAIEMAEKAMRVGFPDPRLYLSQLGQAYCLTGRYEEAIAALKKFLISYPNMLHAHLVLAIAYSELGRETEARAAAAEVLRINPKFSLEVHKQRMPIKDPAVLERHLAALRKAGLK